MASPNDGQQPGFPAESAAHAPFVDVRRDASGRLAVSFGGDWRIGSALPDLTPVHAALSDKTPQILVLAAPRLSAWDSRFLTQLMGLADLAESRGITVDTAQLPRGVCSLLQLAHAVPERMDTGREPDDPSWLAAVGRWSQWLVQDFRDLLAFVGEATLSMGSVVVGKARFRRVDLLRLMQDCGAMALPIVSLISLLVGLILAFVGAVQLQMFGAQVYIADLVGLGMTREMGALMTAVIVSGRSGAAFAAQLGTMNVNQEIDAFKAMGISTFDFLVVPRLLALISMMPILCLYAMLMGIIGGAIVAVAFFDISVSEYITETLRVVQMRHFLIGLFKGLVFGVLVGTAGCLRGMQCGRSASAVGDAATSAVVTSIVFIVVADSVLTLVFNRLRL
ncbi:MlaE family ABC transporter permease [Methylotetracoccus oryzae]|uniref:MlaE family ABC transporter permease n=1 Tax=Methylotetracoccus oryzae TaxID=1919059 RepID=UPI00111858E0|nr:ABC transporter permease [Methylotetracoccus oryzae]